MYYFDDITEYDGTECAIMLGKFDGLHIGHRTLLRTMRENCGELRKMILTFDASDYDARKELFTKKEKRIICEQAGLDAYLNVPFTDEIRRMSAEAFVAGYLFEKCHARQIYVGRNWRFGRNREGNTEILKCLCEPLGIVTFIVPETMLPGDGRERAVSCTDIRSLICEGKTEPAAELLGSPFFIAGTTRPGRQLGTRMHFPTLNLYPPEEKLLPPNGVYETYTRIDGREYPSVTNVGTKPTVTEERRMTVETHLLTLPADEIPGYGTKIQVLFGRWIRPERKFDSVSALQSQLENDIIAVRALQHKKA